MPDLDQLLKNLTSDVAASTRPPGAATAIKQANRRRVKVAAAAGVVAVVAVGGGLAAGNLGGSDEAVPIVQPTTTPSTTQHESNGTTDPPGSLYTQMSQLEEILTTVPGWDVDEERDYPADYDYAFNGPCSRGIEDWGAGAQSGADGGIGMLGFATKPQAEEAAATLVDNLKSCTTTVWRTQPISRTGAVLAYSADAVTWIRQVEESVYVVQRRSTDGPPPLDVQVEVVAWVDAHHAWQEEQRS